MIDLTPFLEIASRGHSHLCPRQILGVRIGLAGMAVLGFGGPSLKKHLLAISETDGCFVDGLSAPTGCSVGQRTLRVVDYGKVAAVLVDVDTERAVRLAPALGVREWALEYAPEEPNHYMAQMQAYQVMPDDVLLNIQQVRLTTPIEEILSRPRVRVKCDACGDEIINEREVVIEGKAYCLSCSGKGYYIQVG
jgi:formylmethanofuran dehydrogenase subunit E